MMTKTKLALTTALTTAGSMLALATHAAAPSVDDVVASSSAAIVDGGTTVFGVFFGMLPTILLYVVPIALVLWGISWILSKFKGKR